MALIKNDGSCGDGNAEGYPASVPYRCKCAKKQADELSEMLSKYDRKTLED